MAAPLHPRSLSRALLVVAGIVLACPILAQSIVPGTTQFVVGHRAVANEIIVKIKPEFSRDARLIGSVADVDAFHPIGDGRVLLMHSRSHSAETLLRELSSRADVLYAEPNYVLHIDQTPNDPYWSYLWGLSNTGQTIGTSAGIPGCDISAAQAWDVTTGSRANVVAVVDTGINYTHPDLTANVWSAPRSFTVTIAGTTMTCPTGAHGYNAITNTFDPMDDNNHGTHVSGTIGAVGNNGVGVAGVNWTASIMGCKFLDSGGNGTLSGAINAIEFAIQAKQALGSSANVRVLSNSWGGGGFSQALLDEINRANTADILFVAAAGNNAANNDANPFYPASYVAPNVVAVAAVDNTDSLAYFSNYGSSSVNLGAPGVDILSTVINGYQYLSGTSMAAPHVSGAAALMLAANGGLSTAQLKSALLGSVDPIVSLAGKTTTGGRLNLYRAVKAAAATGPGFTVSVTSGPQSVVQGTSASYAVSVAPSNGFAGDVALSASGLPSGAGASFAPATVLGGSGSSTLTVTTGNVAPGTYTFAINGSSGGVTTSTSATLTVTSSVSGDFTVAASPSVQNVNRGNSVTFNVAVGALNGFDGIVNMSMSGAPTGVSAVFSPSSVTGSGAPILTVTVAPSAGRSNTKLTVTGVSGGKTHSASVQLRIK